MRLTVTTGSLAGWTSEARITTDHPASRDGVPVLLVDNEPVAILDAAEAGYQLLEATPEERQSLRDAGYCLPEMEHQPEGHPG